MTLKVRGGQKIEIVQQSLELSVDLEKDPTLILFRGIHQELLDIKPSEMFAKLKSDLSLGTNALSVASLAKSIDSASNNYFIATTLFLVARKHLELYRIMLRRELAELRNKARNDIKDLRLAKSFDGATTKDAIDDYIVTHFGNKYARLIEKEQDLLNIRDTLESLRDAWKDRSKQLNILNDLEKRKPPTI